MEIFSNPLPIIATVSKEPSWEKFSIEKYIKLLCEKLINSFNRKDGNSKNVHESSAGKIP